MDSRQNFDFPKVSKIQAKLFLALLKYLVECCRKKHQPPRSVMLNAYFILMQFFSMHSLHTTSYTRTWDTTCTRQQKAHLSVNSCFFISGKKKPNLKRARAKHGWGFQSLWYAAHREESIIQQLILRGSWQTFRRPTAGIAT